MSIADSNLIDLREQLRRREVSSRELVTAALRGAADHAELGALVSTHSELALGEADEADARIAAARRDPSAVLAPLTGIPTVHKDLVDQRGHTTSYGSAAVPDYVAADDSPIVSATRLAGAISIGKTQVPEFGIAGYSENELFPPARNPADPSLTAGGSSGGTAAAVAAGIIPGAIGSDAGGSIRIPSAACGLVGLKPGRGVVPADALLGLVDEAGGPRMGVSGPIARTASDAALLFDAILGRLTEPHLAAVRRANELRGLRIGVSLASPFESWIPIRFSDEAKHALAAAVAALKDRRHAVEEAAIVYDPRYPEAFTTVWTASLDRIEYAPGAEAKLGALAGMFLERARSTAPEALAAGVAALHEFAADASRQWGAYDVVLTPALAFEPPRVGAFRELGPEGDYRLQCEWSPQTSMVNVSGLPAITVPTWRTPEGLPMGVQLIGRAGSEAQLLQLAEQLMTS